MYYQKKQLLFIVNSCCFRTEFQKSVNVSWCQRILVILGAKIHVLETLLYKAECPARTAADSPRGQRPTPRAGSGRLPARAAANSPRGFLLCHSPQLCRRAPQRKTLWVGILPLALTAWWRCSGTACAATAAAPSLLSPGGGLFRQSEGARAAGSPNGKQP